MRSMTRGAQIAAFSVAAIWAGNMVAAKLGSAEIPPLMLSAMRFGVVAIVLAPFCRLRKSELPWTILLSFTLGTCHFGLLFVGLSLAEIGTGAILVQLGAPIAAVAAAYLLKEPLGMRRAIGLAICVVGLVVIVWDPHGTNPVAVGILLLSAGAWAISNVLVRMAPKISPININMQTALFSVPQLVILSLLIEGNPATYLPKVSTAGITALAYTAIVSSVVAYSLWYRLLQTYPVSDVVPFSLLTPVMATIFGALLFGDAITFTKILGCAFILVGVGLVTIEGKMKRD